MKAVLALALIGCGASNEEVGIALTEVEPHPSAGVLLYEGSILDPWCGAVLVRRDAVLTAAQCVLGRDPAAMQFTAADRRSPEALRVRSLEIHPDYRATSDPRVDLAILWLEDHTDDREPARLGGDDATELSSFSTTFVPRGEPFVRSLVEGVSFDGPAGLISARFPKRSVGCHGERGTALYSGPLLLGIATGAFASDSAEDGCVDVLTFAPVSWAGDL